MKQTNIIEMDDIRNQALQQIQMGLDYMQPKRQTFRERLVKYVDQDKQEGKIGVNTIYAIINLGIAIRLADEAQVLFLPRGFGDEEYADNLTNLANFDYDDMGLKQLDYARYWDADFFGYAIRTKKGRDDIKKHPLVSQEDPLTRIPDPYSDYLTRPRFHFFEKEFLKSEMTTDRGFDENRVKNLTNKVNEDLQTDKTYRNSASGLNDVTDDKTENPYISVYNGFTYYDGDLYMITIASETKEIIRAEKILPVRKEEKESGFVDIRTQVTVERSSPVRGNPCGISKVDLIIDKQIANSELMNLRLIDAKFATFGQMNIVNTDIITNTQELTKPSINTKWIKASAGAQDIKNSVYPVPRQSIMQDSYNVTNELSRQIQLDTGISENTLGIAEKNLTLGQSQQVQANANIRLALGITVSNWSEEDFWNFIWLRSYEEYYSKSEKKIIRISNGFGVNVIEIRRDDFLGGANPDIIIDSKKSVETENEKMKANFLAMLPYFTQDPSKPKVIKNMALRYALKLQGMKKEMINIFTYDKDEEKAKSLVPLLNANIMEGAKIDDMEEDQLTFMLIFESALDTEAKRKAIENRRQAYIISGQFNNANQVPQGGMINQSQAQLTANAISQGTNAPTSLANISTGQ